MRFKANVHGEVGVSFGKVLGESLSKAWTPFKDLLQEVPQHSIDLLLEVQIFMTISIPPQDEPSTNQPKQGKMTDKIDTVLKAINDQIIGALPSEAVRKLKMNVNFTSLASSDHSYPTRDPQCSSQIQEECQTSKEEGKEEKGDPKNINTNPPTPPDPSILFIVEKVCKLNSFLESINMVPRSSDVKFVCIKDNDGDVMFINIIKKYDDSPEEELREDESTKIGGLECVEIASHFIVTTSWLTKDGVRVLAATSGCNRLKEAQEDLAGRQLQDNNATPSTQKLLRLRRKSIKSLALKSRKVSSDEEKSCSRNDKEYAMAMRDFKKFFRRRGKFVRQPHDDKKSFRKIKEEKKGNEDRRCFKCEDDSKKDEICLMVLDNNEVLFDTPYYSSLSLDSESLKNEYNKLCKISLRITNKNKHLKAINELLNNEACALRKRIDQLEKNKECKLFSRGNSSTRQWEHFFTGSGKIALAVGTILHYQWELSSSSGNLFWQWEHITGSGKTILEVGMDRTFNSQHHTCPQVDFRKFMKMYPNRSQ
nr:zf-CCHC domain-containing protein/UBN2 domain-containing protein [Tanacetum cinerariifolium]